MSTVEAILDRFRIDFRRARIEPLGNAGGMSGAQFWRVEAPQGTLALRRWPLEHPSTDQLRFIHAVLSHAAARGIDFLPVPVTATNGESFVEHAGHLWELAPWLPGSADYHQSPSVEKVSAAMSALARFHVATADFRNSENATGAMQRLAGPPAITRRHARLRALANGGVAELCCRIKPSTWPDLVPLAEQFIAALPRLIPPAIGQLERLAGAPLPLQPCIRDIWHDHILFSGNRVTGVIDFGALDIDTPATDIARLLGSLVEDDLTGWKNGLAAYSTIRPLSDHESLAVPALDAATTILAGCNWIRWIYIDGRRFENRTQIVERFRRIAVRCAHRP